MSIFKNKMTEVAEEVRTLLGGAAALTIAQMGSELSNANAEIDEQAELIAQIATALEGKAANSGVTLPTLQNPAYGKDILNGKQAIDATGAKITGTIPTKTSSDLTASGATVTVPAGYYESNATKSVSTATQATPGISIDPNGLITASATQTAGYVSAGTKSGTKQLTTQAAKTITPGTTSQVAVDSGVYTTGQVIVEAIPADLVGEDVTAETEDYTTKLASLEAAIEAIENGIAGKAGFGNTGSVETCTLVVSESQVGSITELVYQDSLGSAVEIIADPMTSAAGTYTVVCGTVVHIGFAQYTTTVFETTNIERVSNNVFLVTAKAGETATLSISN